MGAERDAAHGRLPEEREVPGGAQGGVLRRAPAVELQVPVRGGEGDDDGYAAVGDEEDGLLPPQQVRHERLRLPPPPLRRMNTIYPL